MILLTRPIIDSIILEKKLSQMNLKSIICPMLEVKRISYSNSILKKKIDLIIFTSKNGIRNFDKDNFLDHTVFTIGRGTFLFAKSLGYKNVLNANGDSTDLVKLFIKKFSERKLNILHPTSKEKNNTLDCFFLEQGSNYINLRVYETLKNNVSSDKLRLFFSINYGIITLFSLKTAESFLKAITEMSLEQNCHDKVLIVMSKVIKEKMHHISFKKIIVIKKPNQENLLSVIAAL